jgi:hypothetical protein
MLDNKKNALTKAWMENEHYIYSMPMKDKPKLIRSTIQVIILYSISYVLSNVRNSISVLSNRHVRHYSFL